MKRLLGATASFLSALAITSCAVTNPVQVWRDPNYRSAPVDRILVVAVVPADYRQLFENAIGQALLEKGFDVATSGSMLEPNKIREKRSRLS